MVFAQPVRFNKLYTDSYPNIRNVIITDTSYVILGSGGEYGRYILWCNITLDGNMNWKKMIHKNNYDTYHGAANSLKQFGNEYYLAGWQTNGSEYSGLLFKFNNHFDTLWSKMYFTDTSSFVCFTTCLPLNNKIISTGDIYTSGTTNMLFAGFDSSGNYQWHNNYGGSNTDFGSNIVTTYDNGYLFGGYTKSYSPSVGEDFKGDWYLGIVTK